MKKLILLVLILGLCKYGISQGNDIPPFKITKVEFANGDLDGTIITPFGEELKAYHMHLLIPKVYYDGNFDKKRKITLTYKIQKSTGEDMIHGFIRNDRWKYESSQKDKITLYPGKNQSCVLTGWGLVVYQSKEIHYLNYKVGTYNFELYCDDQKIYETFITLHKTEAQIQMEKEYADKAYMDIQKIEFSNKKDGEKDETLTPYGSTLYASQMRYLYPKIYYDAKCADNKEITLYSKIIKPDNTLNKRTSSPEGYTYSTKFTIKPGKNKTQELEGWGYKTISDYQPGNYRYELWYEGNKIYETSFTLYKTEEEIQMERQYASKAYMDIQKMEFANTKNGSDEITPYGGTLYASSMRYLSPRVYYNGKCAENKEITFYYKIIQPDGSLKSWEKSPKGFSESCVSTIYPGSGKILVLPGYGGAQESTYKSGTYRYELWYEGNKIYETSFTLYKTEEEIQMERLYASKAYMDIKKMEFANTKNGSDEITPYGGTLYASSMRYLSPKIYFDAKCTEEKKVTLYSKIIKPDGTLIKGTSSPEGYTYSTTLTFSPGQNKIWNLSGWGSDNGGTYQPGTYRYELWYEGNKIYETTVTFYKTEEEIQMERQYASKAYMDIKTIEFGNVNSKYETIQPFGSRLYASQMTYLGPKIYYDAKCAEDKEITLYYKIIKPDGSLSRGTSSPEGYSSSMKIIISPGLNKSLLRGGWGSENGGTYQPGTYRYELWYEGNKIYQTSVTFYKTEEEIQMERQYASKAYMDIRKMEFANTEKGGAEITPYGGILYASSMRFLKPKIYYNGKCAENKEVTLYWKIIQPDGSIKSSKNSPKGYTSSGSINIKPGSNQIFYIPGWGNEEKSSYKSGTYRYELWYNGNEIYETNFTIYGSGTNTQSGNAIASNNSSSSSSRTNHSISNPDLRNLTLADLFPQEEFPMVWSINSGGYYLKTTLYASGLLEMSAGGMPCVMCNQTGACNVCSGVGGRYDLDFGFIPCGACGGSGKCSHCKGTGYVDFPPRTYRIDPLQIAFPGDGSVEIEANVNGQKQKISMPTQYKYEICPLCGGTGHMDGSGVGFGGTKWCDQCHKMVPDSHCHGCKQCPKCAGKGFIKR